MHYSKNVFDTFFLVYFPAGIYYSKLTIELLEQVWNTFKVNLVFIVNFEHISHLVPMFLLLTLNMQLPAGLYILFCV